MRGRKFRRLPQILAQRQGPAICWDATSALIDILDDHDSIKKLPAGTVGRAYVDFMEREGLTAAGLEAEYARFEDAGTTI